MLLAMILASYWLDLMEHLSVLTEVTLKVVPKPEFSETFVMYGLTPKEALEVFSKVMKTSLEISGACHYPKNNIDFLRLNDLDNSRTITALRIEGPKNSVQERIESLNKMFKEVKEKTILEIYQSDLFWKISANLECFNNSPKILLKSLFHRQKPLILLVNFAKMKLWVLIINIL